MPNPEIVAQRAVSNQVERSEREERVAVAVQSFRIVVRAMQAHAQGVIRASGLSHAQLWLLWEVFGLPGMSVSELSVRLSIKPATASNLLDKVEAKGLIRRERAGPDQRVVRLYVTPAGAELLSTAPRPAQGALLAALSRLDDNKLSQLNAGLEALMGLLPGSVEADAHMPLSGLDPP